MCVRKTAVKREVRLSGVRKGRAKGGGEDKALETGVVNAHDILGWKCLLETHHDAQ